jgi:hypothetical protein
MAAFFAAHLQYRAGKHLGWYIVFGLALAACNQH